MSLPAWSQAVERHLPPAVPRGEAPIAEPNAVPAEQDATPIAGELRSIVLLRADDAVLQPGVEQPGIDSSRVVRLQGIDLDKRLGRFIGQPISRRLIGEVEAEIAKVYRRLGYPFVSISTPEQEVTGGALQFRVMEFRAGQVQVSGEPDEKQVEHIRKGVRLQSGQPVDSRDLYEDLDWINRYPFHRVEAQFSAGAQPGDTDLALSTNSRERHWQLYGGYSNTGTEATGRDRYFVGASAGSLGIPGSVLSYQLTGSSDFWNGGGGGGDFDRSHPRYVSHGARLYVPTVARQAAELTFSSVESNQMVDVFLVRQTIREETLSYRGALSDFTPLRGDVFGGVEAKQQRREIYFYGEKALAQDVNVYQLLGGWSYAWSDSYGHSNAELTAHYSPGGIDSRNSDEQFLDYSQGRTPDAEYSYFNFHFERSTPIGERATWLATLNGQYTDNELPLSVQMGLGGDGLVRGYNADDGSYDRGVILRNQLHLPSFAGFGHDRFADGFAPYVFLDLGYGDDRALGQGHSLASAGVATDYQVARNLFVTMDVAHALSDGGRTDRGDNTFEIRLTLAY